MFRINRLRNETSGYFIFKIFNFLVMMFIIIITLFPYLNVLAKSLNDGLDSMRGGITIMPRKFSLENYKVLFSDRTLYRAFFVTIAKVFCFVVGSVMVQFMAGYALSRRNVWGLKGINVLFLIPMCISGGLIPTYVLFSKLGLLNNFWVYVIPGLWNFYNVIIIRSYMQSSISDSIIEAARIDGALEWTLFIKIVMPLCKPILATIVLWTAVASWNEWTTTLYYIQNPALYTLQYKLMQTLKESERLAQLIQEAIKNGDNVEQLVSSTRVTAESMTNAQIIIVTLPIIATYPFLQKYFVKGVTLGSVKG